MSDQKPRPEYVSTDDSDPPKVIDQSGMSEAFRRAADQLLAMPWDELKTRIKNTEPLFDGHHFEIRDGVLVLCRDEDEGDGR